MKSMLLAITIVVLVSTNIVSAEPPVSDLLFVVAEEKPRHGLIERSRPGQGAPIYLDYRRSLGVSIVEGTEIRHGKDYRGQEYSSLLIRFTPQGAKEIQRMTDINVGFLLAIVTGDKVHHVGEIMEPIAGHEVEISGPSDYDWRPLKEEIDYRIH